MVFDVPDLQTSLTRMMALGGQMDGAVQYSLDGNKVRPWGWRRGGRKEGWWGGLALSTIERLTTAFLLYLRRLLRLEPRMDT
jgi:hypothetical protein